MPFTFLTRMFLQCVPTCCQRAPGCYVATVPAGAVRIVVDAGLVHGTDPCVRPQQHRPRRRPASHRNGRSEAEEPQQRFDSPVAVVAFGQRLRPHAVASHTPDGRVTRPFRTIGIVNATRCQNRDESSVRRVPAR